LEDEAMGQMMKRISVVHAPRPSMLQSMQPQQQSRPSMLQSKSVFDNPQRQSVYDGLQQGLAGFGAQGQQQQRPAVFAQPQQRPSVFLALPQDLGGIDEMWEDDEAAARSANFDVRDVMPQLRREAEQSDAKADRYSMLIQQGMNLVSEVKSALYDADDMAPDSGAELLLEEVRHMLTNVSQTSLAEAAQLQRTSENWLGFRKKIGYQLRVYHNTLEASIERRVETARESNAESRAECDRLWRQIQDLECEVDSPSRLQGRGSISAVGSPNGSEFSAKLSGGLTLEGAHSLLRSFNATLRPYMSEIIPQQAELRSSSEAIALEFLNACKESMKQAPASDAMSNKSPPPLEAPRKPRCYSTPSVYDGDKVESTKPDGLLPLERVKDPFGGDLLQEEQRALLQKVGRSY